MSVESFVEKIIREAVERGEFDDLQGKGRPIDLEAYFNTPEDLRMAYSLLRSNEFVPVEVETIKEIAALKDELRKCQNDSDKANLRTRIEQKELALRLSLERRKRRK
jgi:hypothetical protein